MTSGLDESLRFQAPPGALWRYNNEAYHRLHPTLEAATGRSLARFSREALFAPTGMAGARWELRGDQDDAAQGPPKPGLVLTPRDMARFGLLVLARTRWASRPPLVDPAYLRAALSPSQTLNPSYGYLWWLNGRRSFLLGDDPRPRQGPIVPTAPADLVAAMGAQDQRIYVVPSLDLVVARQGARGGPPQLAPDGFDASWWALLSRAAPA
jgi:CubicO group peptidase (beta-lactamase class C family)